MSTTDADIERQQIEYVFGLTGGELETGPWTALEPKQYEGTWDLSYAYWYEGPPEYCERSEREAWDDTQARTVVVSGGGYLSAPASWRVDDEGAWALVATYQNSGETECPGKHEDAGPRVTPDHCNGGDVCVLCEESIGSEHGYIYIGEGYEAVYSLIEDSTLTREEWDEETQPWTA